MKIKRASTIKRDRRTKTRMAQLDEQIIAVLREDHPQSVRHVFYRMTDPRLGEPVEKSDRGYRHVQARCVALRRSGLIPYHWIADMSRRGYFVNTYDDAGDFLRRMEQYELPTKPRKEGDKRSQHIEYTVEAEAMPAHVLRGILRDEVEALLPQNALEVAKVAERSERAHLARMAAMLGG